MTDQDEHFISGYEYGWNCGNCDDVTYTHLGSGLPPSSVPDGTELTCPECGTTVRVSIEEL